MRDRDAIELEGCWRKVDAAYMGTLLETALFLAVQQGWSWSALPQQGLVEGLQTHGHDPRCACMPVSISLSCIINNKGSY